MSTRYNDGSHYENHQRAAELEDLGAHAHRVGERQGQAEHPSGHETARHEGEHGAHLRERESAANAGHGVTAFGHKDIAALAEELWRARGCPEGSPEMDWSNAVEQLRRRAFGHRDA